MRYEKRVTALSDRSGAVAFPVETDPSFSRFRSDLRELLYANFGPEAGKAEFDLVYQVFIWSETKILGSLEHVVIESYRPYRIDPKKPLVEEFERVAAEREERKKTDHKIQKNIHALGGEL